MCSVPCEGAKLGSKRESGELILTARAVPPGMQKQNKTWFCSLSCLTEIQWQCHSVPGLDKLWANTWDNSTDLVAFCDGRNLGNKGRAISGCLPALVHLTVSHPGV